MKIYYSKTLNRFTLSDDNDISEDSVSPAKGYENFFSSPYNNEVFGKVNMELKNKKLEEGEKIIKCKQCSKWFALSKKSQAFYDEKGLEYPKRCNNCRNSKEEIKL